MFRAGATGQPVDTGEGRQPDVGAPGGPPAAIAVRVILGHVPGDGGNVVLSSERAGRIVLPCGLSNTACAAAARVGPSDLFVVRAFFREDGSADRNDGIKLCRTV